MDSTEQKIEAAERRRAALTKQMLEEDARIERLRKTLKLAEQRAIAQTKCLSEELDEEAAAQGDRSMVITNWEDLSVRELSAMPSSQINWELGDTVLVPTAEASSSQGS